MAHRRAVGIDLVDLREPRVAERGPSRRFVERVFTPAERAWLDDRPGRPEAPWILWAAKEAAYKVVSALDAEPPVFEHAAFEVTSPGEIERRAGLSVAYRGRLHPVRLEVDEDTVLAVSWGPDEGSAVPDGLVWRSGRLDPLRDELGVVGMSVDDIRARRFRPTEARAVHSLPSALARLALRREAAVRLARAEADLRVVCAEGPTGRVPPRLEGGPGGVGVSLSHHGDWVAWAVAF